MKSGSLKAHCLQHEPFEGMAAIEEWLITKNFEISFTRFFESTQLPSPDDIDWLIIMGGGMSVNDEQQLPWLVAEKEFVRQCIAKNKVIVGICLGSQMIASALGAKVYRNAQKEIGWFPIQKRVDVQSSVFADMPRELQVFHWHGETFDLPKEAELIASSAATKNQIFAIRNRVLGFQCHLETTSESLSSISDACSAELIPSTYVQNEETMGSLGRKYIEPMHKTFFKILDHLLSTQ
jgi:GMP synthase-like glutamine amidotransferase